MDKYSKREFKEEINKLRVEFNIGKNGMTQNFIDSVDNYLEAHKIVKIKTLAAKDKDATKYYAEELAKETKAKVVERKGFTFVLYRKNKN